MPSGEVSPYVLRSIGVLGCICGSPMDRRSRVPGDVSHAGGSFLYVHVCTYMYIPICTCMYIHHNLLAPHHMSADGSALSSSCVEYQRFTD